MDLERERRYRRLGVPYAHTILIVQSIISTHRSYTYGIISLSLSLCINIISSIFDLLWGGGEYYNDIG